MPMAVYNIEGASVGNELADNIFGIELLRTIASSG